MSGDISLKSMGNLHLSRNILLIAAALVSFSLWLASTLNTPRILDNIESRLQRTESNYAVMEAKINSTSMDVRDIKNFLMRGHQ